MADENKASDGPQTITVGQAAALIQKSERHVQMLAKEGYIEQAVRGQYTIVNVVRGVIAYYEARLEKNNKTAAASKASEARTKQIEQTMEIRMRNLVPRVDFYQAQDFVISKHRAEIVGLPARVTRDLELRKKIEAEIDGIFSRTAERIERAAHSLEEGGVVLEALGESSTGSVGGET